MSDAVQTVVDAADFGKATARKSGRDVRWPYVPVIDYGDHASQIRGLAYATRAEAVEAAARHIAALRDSLYEKLSDPRYRALRESYGLPRELEAS